MGESTTFSVSGGSAGNNAGTTGNATTLYHEREIDELKQRINLANQILMGGMSIDVFLELADRDRQFRLYKNFIEKIASLMLPDEFLGVCEKNTRNGGYIAKGVELAIEANKVLDEAKFNVGGNR